MNKKTIGKLVLLLNMSVVLFSACSKDDDISSAPTVEIIHLGTHDSPDDRILYTGVPIHLEARINAPGLIRKIELEIRQKGGYGNHTITKEYTGSYVGLKEVPSFHDHPDLVEDIALGDYAFQLKVTDQNGEVGAVAADVIIKSGDGEGGEHHHDH